MTKVFAAASIEVIAPRTSKSVSPSSLSLISLTLVATSTPATVEPSTSTRWPSARPALPFGNCAARASTTVPLTLNCAGETNALISPLIVASWRSSICATPSTMRTAFHTPAAPGTVASVTRTKRPLASVAGTLAAAMPA